MKTKLKQLKEFDFNASDVSCSLAVVSEYKKIGYLNIKSNTLQLMMD